MKFIDFDTHYLNVECFKYVKPEYKTIVPQFNWKYYDSEPSWWKKSYPLDSDPAQSVTGENKYTWKHGLLADENGFHDIDNFPGGKSKTLNMVKVGIEKKRVWNSSHTGPMRGDLNYALPEFRDLTKRKEHLDSTGIHKALLNPYHYMVGMNYRTDPDLAYEMAKSYNKTVTEDCMSSDSLWANIWFPAQNKNMKQNLDLIEEGLSNNAVGVLIGWHFSYADNTPGRFWGDCNWMEPFWAHANEHQYPVVCHVQDEWHDLSIFHHLIPQYKIIDWKNKNRVLLDMFGHYPHPQLMAQLSWASFITSGILDRYPNLRLVYLETNLTWILPLIEKLSKALKRDCSHYLNNWHFAFDTEEPNLVDNIKLIGSDKLIFGTDTPHDDLPGKNRNFDVNNLLTMDISDYDKDLISSKNSIKLLDKTNFNMN
jgi:predicted TIM-barrel fold metal-dependent hydrolase